MREVVNVGDALGGEGNGLAWFAADESALTQHPLYQTYSQQFVGSIDVNTLKSQIAQAYPSTEAAPIMNYLKWVLTLCLAVV